MSPEDILSHPSLVLSDEQRRLYFDNGYLLLESIIDKAWVERLRAAADELVERSRSISESDEHWSLEHDHTPQTPRLRRTTNPAGKHPAFWAFACESPLVDIVADLVGPNVKVVESQLNFKWRDGGAEIRWHQDAQFTPYTNYSQCAFGVFLEDVTPQQSPMAVIPRSHKGELFDYWDDHGHWTGRILERDLAKIDLDKALPLTGPAGTLQIHNCRLIHGSGVNHSDRNRPLLINHYCSADAFPYMAATVTDPPFGKIVRGQAVRLAHLDPRPCPIPPDWSKNAYESVFSYQQHETQITS